MIDIDGLIAHYRKELSAFEEDIERYTTGGWTTGEIVDGQHVDRTEQHVADLRQRRANLARVLDAHEKRRAL